MNLFEFLYLIGCGTSFFMALKELSFKEKKETYSNTEFTSLVLAAILFALTSWGFVIYEKYFKRED